MPRFGLTFKAPRRQPLFNLATIERELKDAIREVGDEVKADFDDVVSDWRTNVTFRITTTVQPDQLRVVVGPHTNAAIWRYVDEGTSAHIITAHTPQGLRYRKGYSARTKPGQAHVGSGTATGDWRRAQQVTHPGSAPREFTQTIMSKWKPVFKDAIDDTIRDNT